MRFANARLVASMQARIDSGFYGDTANYIARVVSTANTFGEPTYIETTTAISCSFTDAVGSRTAIESWKGYTDVLEIQAEIRFTSVVPSKGDAITLTNHFDSAYTDKRYHIIGIKDRGVLGYVCALKAVDL